MNATMLVRFAAGVLCAALAVGCAQGPPQPAQLDTRNDACGQCRMAVSEQRFAAQLVAPAEEPVFFDDVGCLAAWLEGGGEVPRGALGYVADHRTREWTPAAAALYTRVPEVETPMGSHIIAHRDAASRDADPDSRGGQPLSAAEVFGPRLPEGR
jgi:copper chaperone NosL